MHTRTPSSPPHVSPDLPPGIVEAGSTQGAGVTRDLRYKLTAFDVLEMRARYASSRVTFRQIAKEYGVSMACARYAIVGQTWSELPGALAPRLAKGAPPSRKGKPIPWERQKEYIRICKERHPERYVARSAANYATKSGKLIKQPCEKCGSLDVEAHHEDYSRPLDVRWFCREHHTEHHKYGPPVVPDYSI